MKTLALLAFAVVAVLPGCAEPAAVMQLVGGADQALAVVSESDKELEKAVLAQIDGQMAALDDAYLADIERLAEQHGALGFADVTSAKALYDQKWSALYQSRMNLQEVFSRRSRNLLAARQLLLYAQDLVTRNRAAWYDARQYLQFVLQSQSIAAAAPPSAASTATATTKGTQP